MWRSRQRPANWTHNKEVYRRWKQGQVTQWDNRAAVSFCRGRVRKAKADLDLNLVRDVKGSRKGFYEYINSTRKTRENVPTAECSGGLLTQDTENTLEVLNVLWSTGTGCPGKWWSPHPWMWSKTCRCGTSGHGLAGTVVLVWWLDLMILEVFSNLHDSMILLDAFCASVFTGQSLLGLPVGNEGEGDRHFTAVHTGRTRGDVYKSKNSLLKHLLCCILHPFFLTFFPQASSNVF